MDAASLSLDDLAAPLVRPVLRQVVLDATDARTLAEFYRELLGWNYRDGDEMPAPGEPGSSPRRWCTAAAV